MDEEVNGKCIINFASLKPTTYYQQNDDIQYMYNPHIIMVVVVSLLLLLLFTGISIVAFRIITI